jgi:1-acylglycerone phosphate reductase
MDQVQALYNTNLFGPMRMVKAFVPLLIVSGDARVIQIGSIGAVLPVPFGSANSGAKSALHAYGNSLRVELAPFGCVLLTFFLQYPEATDVYPYFSVKVIYVSYSESK